MLAVARAVEVKALVLTPEGERLSILAQPCHRPGPLSPLDQGDLSTLTRLLAKVDQATD